MPPELPWHNQRFTSAGWMENAGLTLGRPKTKRGGGVRRATAGAAAMTAEVKQRPNRRARLLRRTPPVIRACCGGVFRVVAVAALSLSCLETAHASDAIDGGFGFHSGPMPKPAGGAQQRQEKSDQLARDRDRHERTPPAEQGLLRGKFIDAGLTREEKAVDYYLQGDGPVMGVSEVVMARQEAIGRYSSGEKHRRRMTRSVADGVGGVVPKGVLDVKMNPRSPLENERSSTSADDDEVDVKEEEEPYKMLLLAIYIVVGCGVGTLVMLCVIRKAMDLCLLRNDPSGSLRYSQEEGLPKNSIERLPQTKYKKPAPKAVRGGTGAVGPAAGSRKMQQVQAQQQHQQEEEGVLDAGVATERGRAGAFVPGGADGEDATGVPGERLEDRDSTEDMCAICLIDYEAGDPIRIIPGCRHQFHKDCIDPWLETKAVCAYCKAKVEVKKSICDRLFRSASDRMGIHLVTLQQDPTPHHFSSSRRTYTSQEVRQMIGGPHLPTAYRTQSDFDYVGSMVAPRTTEAADAAGGVGGAVGGEVVPPAGAGTGAGAARSAVLGAEPQGSIVVQPVSAPSFTVVPREFLLGSAGADSANTSEVEAGASSTAGVLGGGTDSAANSVVGAGGLIVGGGGVGYGIRVERVFSGRGDATMAKGGSDDSDGGVGEEKKETEAREEKMEEAVEGMTGEEGGGGEETAQEKWAEGGAGVMMEEEGNGGGDTGVTDGGVSQVSRPSAIASTEAMGVATPGGLAEQLAEGASVVDEEPRVTGEEEEEEEEEEEDGVKESESGMGVAGETAEVCIRRDDSAAAQLPQRRGDVGVDVGVDDGVIAAAVGETGKTWSDQVQEPETEPRVRETRTVEVDELHTGPGIETLVDGSNESELGRELGEARANEIKEPGSESGNGETWADRVKELNAATYSEKNRVDEIKEPESGRANGGSE